MPKKTKSIKSTDKKANKPWLKITSNSKYKIGTREPNKIILIATEGQTEKLYFKSFPVCGLEVEIYDSKGQSKLKLIEFAEKISEKYKYDEIWCVFDMDVKNGEKEFADFDNAIAKGQKKEFKIAYSNDVFELWVYLHYQYTDQKNLRKFYYKFLSEKWNLNYEKEGKTSDIYQKLEKDNNACQAEAIKRARKLFNEKSNLTYHEQNPVTKIYELVEFLNKNRRR